MFSAIGSSFIKAGVQADPLSIVHSAGAASVFGVVVDERVVGAVIVRVWPGNAEEGDVHVVAAKRRMLHYETVMTFLAFLKSRENLLAIKRWKVVLEPENEVAQRALGYLGFADKGLQPFPILGTARIMTREVS